MNTAEHIGSGTRVTVRRRASPTPWEEETVEEIDPSDVEVVPDEEPTAPYLRVTPQRVDAILKLCDDLWRRGSRQAALQRIQETARREPADVAVHDRLVEMLLALGRHREAVARLYDFAERVESDHPEIVRHVLERIVHIDPRSEPARSLLAFDRPSIRNALRWFAGDLPTRPQPA